MDRPWLQLLLLLIWLPFVHVSECACVVLAPSLSHTHSLSSREREGTDEAGQKAMPKKPKAKEGWRARERGDTEKRVLFGKWWCLGECAETKGEDFNSTTSIGRGRVTWPALPKANAERPFLLPRTQQFRPKKVTARRTDRLRNNFEWGSGTKKFPLLCRISLEKKRKVQVSPKCDGKYDKRVSRHPKADLIN